MHIDAITPDPASIEVWLLYLGARPHHGKNTIHISAAKFDLP